MHLRLIWVYLLIAVLVSACTSISPTPTRPTPIPTPTKPPSPTPTPTPFAGVPEFINYPAPQISITPLPYDTTLCFPDPVTTKIECPSGTNVSPLAVYCDKIVDADTKLGFLAPLYPISTCLVYAMGDYADEIANTGVQRIRPEGYLYYKGGMIGFEVGHLILRDGNYELLASIDDFRTIYAPIETAEEALGYAIAVTGHQALYDLKYDDRYVYERSRIKDTYVVTDADGYWVYLYEPSFFGCGPHYTYSVSIRVSHAGDIEEGERIPLFRDPIDDNICVD